MPSSFAISPAVTNKVLFNNRSPSPFLFMASVRTVCCQCFNWPQPLKRPWDCSFSRFPPFTGVPFPARPSGVLAQVCWQMIQLIQLLTFKLMSYLYYILAYMLMSSIYFAKLLIFLFTIFSLSVIMGKRR